MWLISYRKGQWNTMSKGKITESNNETFSQGKGNQNGSERSIKVAWDLNITICSVWSKKHRWRKETWWNTAGNSAVKEKWRCCNTWRKGDSKGGYQKVKWLAKHAVYLAKSQAGQEISKYPLLSGSKLFRLADQMRCRNLNVQGGKPVHNDAGEVCLNSLRPRQNGRLFADDIFKWIFLNENVWIPIKISLKFVPQGPISNIPALVQIMAWRRSGDKHLSGPMMVRLPTHICVTRPQWVNEGGQRAMQAAGKEHYERLSNVEFDWKPDSPHKSISWKARPPDPTWAGDQTVAKLLVHPWS